MGNIYQFQGIENLQSFLDESLGKQFLLPQKDPVFLEYFHNGDIMTVNLCDREFEWEPLNPGCVTTSRLSFRFMHWFMRGFIALKK